MPGTELVPGRRVNASEGPALLEHPAAEERNTRQITAQVSMWFSLGYVQGVFWLRPWDAWGSTKAGGCREEGSGSAKVGSVSEEPFGWNRSTRGEPRSCKPCGPSKDFERDFIKTRELLKAFKQTSDMISYTLLKNQV